MYKRHLLIFSSLLLIAFIFWSFFSLQRAFLDVALKLEEYISNQEALGIIIFVGLAALSAMLSPFSSVPLVPVAAMIWGNILTSLLLLLGWLIGEIFSYLIGEYAAHPLLKRITPFEKIQEYRQYFSAKSEFLIVLLFRLSMPAEVPGYVLGAIKYNFGKYLLATFIAEFPFAFITVYVSETLISKKPIAFLLAVTANVAYMGIMFYMFRKRIKDQIEKHAV